MADQVNLLHLANIYRGMASIVGNKVAKTNFRSSDNFGITYNTMDIASHFVKSGKQ